jgi:hypothetical protein
LRASSSGASFINSAAFDGGIDLVF